MSIDLHFMVTAALGVGCGVLGWLWRELWTAVEQLRKDLGALEVRIGTDYIRYDRLQDAFKPVLDALTEIKHTLQGKADKP